MAQTREVLAKDFVIMHDGKIIAMATEFSFEVNKEEIEVSTLSSDGWKKVIGGMKSWTISGGAIVIRGAVATGESDYHILLQKLIDNDTPVEVGVRSEVTDDKYWTGLGLLTSLSENASAGGLATYSFSIGGDGPLTAKVKAAAI